METMAVYWEPVIRTYGFNVLERQVLCRFGVPLDGSPVWARSLERLEDRESGFRLVWSLARNDGYVTFFLLCDDKNWNRLKPIWDNPEGAGIEMGTRMKSAVDLVFFQGPHFGDRYGIMDYTYRALAVGQVPLLAVTCSAASIHVVVPEGWGRRTKDVLGNAFEIPTQVKSKIVRSSGVDR